MNEYYAFWGMMNNISGKVLAKMLEDLDNDIMGDVAVSEAQKIIDEPLKGDEPNPT